MIEVIEIYEFQKEKYQPVIRHFERELSLYVRSELSEFKLNIPTFKGYLTSDSFKDKFAAATVQLKQHLAAPKGSKSLINSSQEVSKEVLDGKRADAEALAAFIVDLLERAEKHEVSLPVVAIIELLYALTNADNRRIGRQQSLYLQMITRLSQINVTSKENQIWLCHCLEALSEFFDTIRKKEFNDLDLQYPLLLALSLSHTSPRHVKVFLDKQTPQYEGDFSKALKIALSEYDDLLLSSQLNEAYQWLNAYKPIIGCETVVEDVFTDFETVEFETVETKDDIKQEESVENKPHLNFHSATVTTILDTLKPYFVETEHQLLDELLNGGTIDGKLYFRGKTSTIMGFFRDLLKNKIAFGDAQTANWLCFYFNADHREKGANQSINLGTAIDYFKKETIPHVQIDISAILLKKNQKNTP